MTLLRIVLTTRLMVGTRPCIKDILVVRCKELKIVSTEVNDKPSKHLFLNAGDSRVWIEFWSEMLRRDTGRVQYVAAETRSWLEVGTSRD